MLSIQAGSLAVAATLSALSVQADGAQGSAPLCVLKSVADANAEIRLRHANVSAILWVGGFYWRGRQLRPFRLSMFQGYGSKLWSVSAGERDGGFAVPFYRGAPSYGQVKSGPVDAYLFPGLGADLYYGNNQRDPGLIMAAEGFWRVGPGCRDRMLFHSAQALPPSERHRRASREPANRLRFD